MTQHPAQTIPKTLADLPEMMVTKMLDDLVAGLPLWRRNRDRIVLCKSFNHIHFIFMHPEYEMATLTLEDAPHVADAFRRTFTPLFHDYSAAMEYCSDQQREYVFDLMVRRSRNSECDLKVGGMLDPDEVMAYTGPYAERIHDAAVTFLGQHAARLDIMESFPLPPVILPGLPLGLMDVMEEGTSATPPEPDHPGRGGYI